jgi:hypothetical protein
MQKKKSFLQQQISLSQNSIQKKLTNSIFYNKSIVRGDISNKKIQIIDSFDDYTFENKIFKEVGFSIASFTYFFKHKLNPILRFKLKTYTSNKISSNYINFLEKSLNSLLFLENKFNSLYVIKPAKSGFFCYSSGFCGFSPYSSIIYSSQNFNLLNKTFFLNNFNLKDFVLFKFFFSSIKVLLRPRSLTYNFSKKKNKKIRYNFFNIVFFSKPSSFS